MTVHDGSKRETREGQNCGREFSAGTLSKHHFDTRSFGSGAWSLGIMAVWIGYSWVRNRG